MELEKVSNDGNRFMKNVYTKKRVKYKMINFKDIALEDKALIHGYFKKGQYRNSECTFTNLFIWRDCYAVQWAVIDELLVIKPTVGEDTWILPPYGDYTKHDVNGVLEQVQEYFSSIGKPLIIRAITEEFAQVFVQYCPGRLALEEERDLFDYFYAGDDLRQLKGRKYHSKRNHLSNFRKNYPDYVYRLMTEADIPAVKEYIDLWCKQKECQGKFDAGMICERKAIYEALHYFHELDYTAALIELDGQIVAFTMGELVNDQTLVVHVEKADGQINGLYGMIHQEFLLQQWPEVAFVNREEDTGDEGLRKAKESYYPIELIKKYKGVWQ